MDRFSTFFVILLLLLSISSSPSISAEVKSNRDQLIVLFNNVRSPGPTLIRSISSQMDQAAIMLLKKDDPQLLISLVKVYNEVARAIGHHDFMDAFQPYYEKNQKLVDQLIDKTLSKKDALNLKERLKAVLYSAEHGNG